MEPQQRDILKESILPDLNILTVSSLLKEKSQDKTTAYPSVAVPEMNFSAVTTTTI